MNINELKTTLASIEDQMAEVEAKVEVAAKNENFEALAILNDTWEALDNRAFQIQERIDMAGRPVVSSSDHTRNLISANID